MSAQRDWFLDAVAIAAEHQPEPVRYRRCGHCGGDGERRRDGWSLNPHSGVMHPDPQCEESQECGWCEGTGAVPISFRKGKV